METIINGVKVFHKDSSGLDLYKDGLEREWRDSELLRTDRFVVIPDYPSDLLTYRAALRDYPSQPDFPNGTRPEE